MMKKALAFDIGGTKICHCIVDEAGNIVSEITKINTPKTSKDIYDYLKKISDEGSNLVDVISIATAGCVNNDNNAVVGSTGNLPKGYSDIVFSSLSDKKVFVENDANAAAWAEFSLGAAKGYGYSITITLGTGIGGGIIIDNRLLKGAQGLAAEVGSLKIYPDKRRKCTCDGYDCWESYASGTGLKTNAVETAKTSELFKTSLFAHKLPQDLTTYDVIEGVKKNDEFCSLVFADWQNFIACGLISLVNILNPECIVISGGLGQYTDCGFLEKEINDNSVVSDVVVLHAEMKNHTGMIGCALLAFKNAG